jgi:hypothetical protein
VPAHRASYRIPNCSALHTAHGRALSSAVRASVVSTHDPAHVAAVCGPDRATLKHAECPTQCSAHVTAHPAAYVAAVLSTERATNLATDRRAVYSAFANSNFAAVRTAKRIA